MKKTNLFCALADNKKHKKKMFVLKIHTLYTSHCTSTKDKITSQVIEIITETVHKITNFEKKSQLLEKIKLTRSNLK